MKSYTDIEQSKELAEMLPIKSADMYYGYKKDKPEYLPYSNTEVVGLCFPCWSLTALLSVLPEDITVHGTVYSINIHTKNKKWFIDYKCNNEEFIGSYSNIFIDACFESIIKLHELNLL